MTKKITKQQQEEFEHADFMIDMFKERGNY